MEASKLRSNSEVFHHGVKKYQTVWGRKRDSKKYSEENREARGGTAVQGVESFYDFITVAYLAGWGEHFHFTPFAPHEPIEQAMAFFAHKLANTMGLKAGMKVLDIGCGVGGPAREIARFIGCEIVGININQGHVDQAIEMTSQAGLSHLITFVKGDFMDMPFAQNSFDAAYAIEATAHAPSLPQVYNNIHQILKPGGIFLTSEWVMTPKFDPSKQHHVTTRNHIERGNAVPSLPMVTHVRTSLQSVDFTILHEEDYAHHWTQFLQYPAPSPSPPNSLQPHLLSGPDLTFSDQQRLQEGQSPVLVPLKTGLVPAPAPSRPIVPLPASAHAKPREWYYPLQGRTFMAANLSDWWLTWKMSPAPRKISYWIVRSLEKFRLYPRGVTEAMDILREAVDGLADGGKEDVFSPCWWFVCRKDEHSATFESGIAVKRDDRYEEADR